MTLGGRLKALRLARDWTQQDLSDRAGVRQPLISQLETGRKKDTLALIVQRLARALGVTVEELLDGECEEELMDRLYA
jgi:Predicted transcriptional regulators